MLSSVPEPEAKNATIVIRLMDPVTDAGMVYASWRAALWYDGFHRLHSSQAERFYSAATKAIRALLEKPSIQVRIATLSDDPHFIAGYAVMEGNHLHWVCVKQPYWRRGIGSLLIRGFKTVSEPFTKIGKELADRKTLQVKEEKKNG